MLQSLSHPLSHWPHGFLPHIHFLSPSSSLCPLQILLNTHTLMPIPPPASVNALKLTYYVAVPAKGLRKWQRKAKKLLVLRELEWEEKRILETDHVDMGRVSIFLLCTGSLYLESEKPHASFFWRQVSESPWDHWAWVQWTKGEMKAFLLMPRGNTNSRDN